ncbi:MAG: type II secretion system protein [Verrucomicrobiota bacterium]
MLKRRAGFTLIEILAVVLIVGLLIGLFQYVAALVLQRSQQAKVQKEIGLILKATTAYREKFGTFPIYPAQDGDICWGMNHPSMQPVVDDMALALWEDCRVELPRVDHFNSYLGNRGNVVGYRYYCRGGDNIYIWSHGNNGMDGDEDDIGEKPPRYNNP